MAGINFSNAGGFDIETDDNEFVDVTEHSINGNIGIGLGAEDAAELLNEIAGDVPADDLEAAFEFLVEHHGDVEADADESDVDKSSDVEIEAHTRLVNTENYRTLGIVHAVWDSETDAEDANGDELVLREGSRQWAEDRAEIEALVADGDIRMEEV